MSCLETIVSESNASAKDVTEPTNLLPMPPQYIKREIDDNNDNNVNNPWSSCKISDASDCTMGHFSSQSLVLNDTMENADIKTEPCDADCSCFTEIKQEVQYQSEDVSINFPQADNKDKLNTDVILCNDPNQSLKDEPNEKDEPLDRHCFQGNTESNTIFFNVCFMKQVDV